MNNLLKVIGEGALAGAGRCDKVPARDAAAGSSWQVHESSLAPVAPLARPIADHSFLLDHFHLHSSNHSYVCLELVALIPSI